MMQSFKNISPLMASTAFKREIFSDETKSRYPPFAPWTISISPAFANCWAIFPKNCPGISMSFAISLRPTTSPFPLTARKRIQRTAYSVALVIRTVTLLKPNRINKIFFILYWFFPPCQVFFASSYIPFGVGFIVIINTINNIAERMAVVAPR